MTRRKNDEDRKDAGVDIGGIILLLLLLTIAALSWNKSPFISFAALVGIGLLGTSKNT